MTPGREHFPQFMRRQAEPVPLSADWPEARRRAREVITAWTEDVRAQPYNPAAHAVLIGAIEGYRLAGLFTKDECLGFSLALSDGRF